jgi:hypothetical protein
MDCCALIAAIQLMAGDTALTTGDWEWEDKTAEEMRRTLETLDNNHVEIVNLAEKLNEVRKSRGLPIATVGDTHEIGETISFLTKWLYEEAGRCDSYQVVSTCSKCNLSRKRIMRN